MDYSASIHDADHSADASPWGNSPSSSPRADRTTFGSITADPPASPFRYPSQSPGNGLQDDGGFGASDAEFRRPDTASTVSAAESSPSESNAEDLSRTLQQHPYDHESQGFLTGDQGPPPPPQQPQPGQAPGDHAQQQQQQPQPRRPPQPPQFKLQAKITGLERTGRKDPILRFDVHVWTVPADMRLENRLTIDADKPLQISDHAIPRCPSSPF